MKRWRSGTQVVPVAPSRRRVRPVRLPDQARRARAAGAGEEQVGPRVVDDPLVRRA